MSKYNSLKAALALGLAGIGTTQAYSQESSQLENIVATAPVDSSMLKSGVGFYPAKDSYHATGINGVNQFELYSDAPKTKANLYVVLKANEGVYDIRNEHSYESKILIVPEGSSMPDSKKNLTLSYKRTIDGKAAYGAGVALGAELATGKWAPSLIIGGAHTIADYAVGKMRNRKINSAYLKNVPNMPLNSTADQVIVPADLNGHHYILSMDVNPTGKKNNGSLSEMFSSKADMYRPDKMKFSVVNLEQYGGQGQAIEIDARDHRMRQLLLAIVEGYGYGSLYDAIKKSGSSIDNGTNTGGGNGGSTTVIPPTTPPTNPTGITGGSGNQGTTIIQK